MGFSSCGARAQYLWRTGLAAPQLVGSSWTRALTHILCIGRWILFFFFGKSILNHCTAREVPGRFLKGSKPLAALYVVDRMTAGGVRVGAGRLAKSRALRKGHQEFFGFFFRRFLKAQDL